MRRLALAVRRRPWGKVQREPSAARVRAGAPSGLHLAVGELLGGSWVVAHTLFGAVMGIAPWLRRRIGARSARRPEATHAGVLRPRTSG